MKQIRRRRNFYALLFSVSIYLTVWLGATFLVEAAFAFGTISIASLIFLVRQSRLLYDAALIWDNRILAVSAAFISTEGGKGKNHIEKTVVSTFGIIIGAKIYTWGCKGVHGVRLKAIEIDRARMYLTFGDAAQIIQVELLHGMVKQEAVQDFRQKLWNETGVMTSISGW